MALKAKLDTQDENQEQGKIPLFATNEEFIKNIETDENMVIKIQVDHSHDRE